MKRFFTCLFLLSVIGINGAAEEPFKVVKNGYGDTIIRVSNVRDWEKRVALFKKIEEQTDSFFIELPLGQAEVSEALIKKHGFSLYHANNERMQLVKSMKDHPIPPIVTGNNTVKIFISRMIDDRLQVLFTKEAGRIAASLPGGTLEYQEDICTGAERELREELSYVINKGDLRFLGVLNRIKAFEYRITHNEFAFYLPYDDKQKIIVDGKEVKDFIWAYVDDVLASGCVTDLSVLEHHLAMLKSLSEGKRGVPCISMLDHRQLNPKAKKNPNDIMIFCPAE